MKQENWSFNPNIEKYEQKTDRSASITIKVIALTYLVLSIIAAGSCIALGDGQSHLFSQRRQHSIISLSSIDSPCIKTEVGYFECSTSEAKEKAKLKPLHYIYAETINATVTAYSAEESPGINARGELPTLQTIACPRSILLGTKVIGDWQGAKERICADRTALKYNGRFDLFVKTRREAIAWGKRKEEITIYYITPIYR